MAHNEKPTPKSQEEISQGFITPYEFSQMQPPTFVAGPNRAEQRAVGDAPLTKYKIGLEEIDIAFKEHIENNIKPYVIKNQAKVDVPVEYSTPERWKTIQKDGYLRDKNGKALYPLIAFKKEQILPNRVLGRKLDGNRVHLYKPFKKSHSDGNNYDALDSLFNRQEAKEYDLIVIPDYINITYSGIIFCDYLDQLNNIIESLNYASNSYWGDKEKYAFLTIIESFTPSNEIDADGERIVTCRFSIRLNGYLIPDTINKEISSIKKDYSKAVVRLSDEVIVTPDVDLNNLPAPTFPVTPLPPSGLECASASIWNAQSNPTWTGSVGSGLTFVLEEVCVLDAFGTSSQLPYIPSSSGYIFTASAPSASVQNQSSSFTQEIASGDTYVLPLGNILDSDGITPVQVDYIPSSSGYMFTCSLAAQPPSMSLQMFDHPESGSVVSDVTYGDTVYLRYTATNFTPTNVNFIIRDEYQNYIKLPPSSGSMVSYSVDQYGPLEFYVEGDAGSATSAYTVAATTGFSRPDTGSYDRPSDWIAIPSIDVDGGEEVFYGLFAVYDKSENVGSIKVEGDFTINLGDGTGDTDYASGTVVNFDIDYANVSDLSTRGYRQALIKVTPQSGSNITLLDLDQATTE